MESVSLQDKYYEKYYMKFLDETERENARKFDRVEKIRLLLSKAGLDAKLRGTNFNDEDVLDMIYVSLVGGKYVDQVIGAKDKLIQYVEEPYVVTRAAINRKYVTNGLPFNIRKMQARFSGGILRIEDGTNSLRFFCYHHQVFLKRENMVRPVGLEGEYFDIYHEEMQNATDFNDLCSIIKESTVRSLIEKSNIDLTSFNESRFANEKMFPVYAEAIYNTIMGVVTKVKVLGIDDDRFKKGDSTFEPPRSLYHVTEDYFTGQLINLETAEVKYDNNNLTIVDGENHFNFDVDEHYIMYLDGRPICGTNLYTEEELKKILNERKAILDLSFKERQLHLRQPADIHFKK